MLMFERIAGWIAAAVGVLLVAWGAGLRQGRQGEQQKAKEADYANARRVEDAADTARASGGDATERLQQAGRLRD